MSNEPNLRTKRRTIDGTTVCPGHCFVRQQLTQGSFGVFLLHLNLERRRFDPKLSDFSNFKPRNITRAYLSVNHE